MIIASASIDSLWHYESVDEAYGVEKSDEERGIGRDSVEESDRPAKETSPASKCRVLT